MYNPSPFVKKQRTRLFLLLLLGISLCAFEGCRKKEEQTNTAAVELNEHPAIEWNATPLDSPHPFQFKQLPLAPTQFMITEELTQATQGATGEKMKVTTQREVTLSGKSASVLEANGTLRVPMELTETRIAIAPRPGTWEDNTADAINNTTLEAMMGAAAVSVEPHISSKPGVESHVEQIAFNLGLLLPSQRPSNDISSPQWADAVGWRQKDGSLGIEVQRKIQIQGTQPCGKETCTVVHIQIQLKAETKQETAVRSISSLSPSPDQWHISFNGSGKGEAKLLLRPGQGVPIEAELNYTFEGILSGTQNGNTVVPIEQYRSVRATLKQKGTTTP